MKNKNKLAYLLIAIIASIGVLSLMITPVFLLVSSLILRTELPQWFLVVNIILSSLDLIGILLSISIWLFDDNKKEK